MRYFAEVINNVVVNIAHSEGEFPLPGWIEYSEDGSFRLNAAGIGAKYHADKDAFEQLKPYPSWVLDQETLRYNAPIEKPQEIAAWNEVLGAWETPE
jgi:hypothetical protein